MTNPNKSHITIVADRSGSMSMMQTEAENGINAFIDEQKRADGDCTLYFVEFDGNGYDIVHDGDIQTAPKYTLVSRGATPLYDSVMRAIHTTGERLAALPEQDRPGNVFFVIQTDGYENASAEYRNPSVVTAKIKDQESTWKWNFVFLATGIEAVTQAAVFAGTQMHDQNIIINNARTVDRSYVMASAAIAQTRSGVPVAAYGGDVTQDETDDSDL